MFARTARTLRSNECTERRRRREKTARRVHTVPERRPAPVRSSHFERRRGFVARATERASAAAGGGARSQSRRFLGTEGGRRRHLELADDASAKATARRLWLRHFFGLRHRVHADAASAREQLDERAARAARVRTRESRERERGNCDGDGERRP